MALVGFGGTAILSRFNPDPRTATLLSIIGGVGMFLVAVGIIMSKRRPRK